MTPASKTTKSAKAAQSSQMSKTTKVVKAPAAIPKKAAPKAAAKSAAKQPVGAKTVVSPVKAASAVSSGPSPATPKATSKQSQLIEMLKSSTGATIAQMIAATGWQAHTVRGTISGSLRKRLGLNVACATEGDARVYRIVEAS